MGKVRANDVRDSVRSSLQDVLAVLKVLRDEFTTFDELVKLLEAVEHNDMLFELLYNKIQNANAPNQVENQDEKAQSE